MASLGDAISAVISNNNVAMAQRDELSIVTKQGIPYVVKPGQKIRRDSRLKLSHIIGNSIETGIAMIYLIYSKVLPWIRIKRSHFKT